MTKIKSKSIRNATIALTFFILTGNQLFAQNKSIIDSVYNLNEVVVTESKKTNKVLKTLVPLHFTPVSISSVGVSVLESRGISNLNDALKQVTGIKPVMTYGGFQTFYMRGFGSPVMMVDGQRDERMNYSQSAPVTDLTAVESVELLKGPASVLYGHSAVGGIINIVRKSPTSAPHFNASVSYGSWNSRRANVGAGGLLLPGLSVRADVGMSNQDGWRNNGDKRLSAYLAFAYQISTKDKLELRLGYVDDWYGTETGIPVVKYDVYDNSGNIVAGKNSIPGFISREQRFNDPSDFLKNQNKNVSLKYSRKFSDVLSVNNTMSYTKDDINYFSTERLSYLTSPNPIYNTYYDNEGQRTYICLDTLQRTSPLRFSHLTATLQNQLDISAEFKTGAIKHHLLGGWSVMYLDRTSYTGYNNGVDVYGPGYLGKISTINPVLNQGAVLTSFSKANPRHDYTNGFYLQDMIELSAKLKAMLAGRADLFNFETAGSVPNINGGRDHSENTLKWSQSKNISFTYRAGLVYLPIEKMSIYGSFATFFKPYRDVFNSTYIYVNKNGNVFVPKEGEEIFEPEQGYQAEVGFRFEQPDVWRLNASAFYIRKENIRENLATVQVNENGIDVSKKVYAQVGVVNSRGFDVDWQVRPYKSLTFDGGYTFTMAQYGDFKSNPYVEGDSRKNNYQTYSPKHMAFAWVTYNLAHFVAGIGVNGSSETFTNATNTISMPSYVVADAHIGYTFKKGVKLTYHLKNFTDVTYYEWALGTDQFVPSLGRNHMITMSLSL